MTEPSPTPSTGTSFIPGAKTSDSKTSESTALSGAAPSPDSSTRRYRNRAIIIGTMVSSYQGQSDVDTPLVSKAHTQ
jgi:hypothetical protein